jgi:hypothetical protein
MIHIMSHKTIPDRWIIVTVIGGTVDRREVDGFGAVRAAVEGMPREALNAICAASSPDRQELTINPRDSIL